MRRSAIFMALFLLSACGGGGDATACSREYWDGTFGTCVPDGWNALNRDALEERGIAADTLAAFQAEEAVAGQFPTATVTYERLTEEVDPATYSKANVDSVTILEGYEKIDERSLTIDDAKVTLHIFKARPEEDDAVRRFYQASTVADGKGYTVTVMGPVTIEKALEQQILLIFDNATFQRPAEGG